MSLRQSISLVCLALALAFLSWFWINGGSFNLVLHPSKSDDHGPDFLIVQVNSRQFDEQGQFKYALQAEELAHYANGLARLHRPELKFSHEQKSPWHMTALTGQVSDLTHRVSLDQQVQLNQTAPSSWQLSTEHLSVDLDHSLIQTDYRVQLKYPLGKLEAQGMRANLKTKEIQLLDHVQGTYETP